MENKEDQILNDFFNKNKTEIEDFGFSNRVLNKLPKKKTRNTGWIVPMFTLLGVVVSLLLIDIRALYMDMLWFISETPLYYFIAAIMVVPLIFLPFYLYWERKNAY